MSEVIKDFGDESGVGKGEMIKTEAFREEVAKVRAELKPWEKEQIEHQGKLKVASTEKKLLSEKHEAGRVAYLDAQKQLDDIQKKVETKTSSIKDLQTKIKENKLDSSKARKLEQECLKEQEALMALEQTARQKVMELKSVMESKRNQGSVLKAIFQAKSSNSIQGFIMPRFFFTWILFVAKYDVAVSTACGGLDYIVVETTAAAQACVAMLRKNNLGVATFMILVEKKGRDYNKSPKWWVPSNNMKLAFFAAMGNTVVAKDIDQATRIAYGGNQEFRRVVTLDGALFEKSGTMSGGGNKPRGGKSEFTFISFLTWIKQDVKRYQLFDSGSRPAPGEHREEREPGRWKSQGTNKGKLKKRSRHHPPNNNFYLHVMMSHNSNHQV
ncbi:hypothetical protein LXL04_025390 [Taraxacum kok-saghyz]